nr:RDD family protein [Mycolicibacterium fortuitum]
MAQAESCVTTGCDDAPRTRLASWRARAGALALDVVPGAAVVTTTVLVALSVPLRGTLWWVCMAIGAIAVLWTGFNSLLLPVRGGQSLGRAALGIAHVGTESPGLDEAQPDTRPRRRAVVLVLTAAALCGFGAAVSYTVVHQHDRSIADAGAEIAVLGPRMVEQILSYHPETLQGDFDRAQSLVTDAYREELRAQQQTVRKASPARNEYWVSHSSVLSATPGHATMLLFLQGQRGTPPNQRYLTASLRAAFVETGSGVWRVDDLTVVTNPPAAETTP